LTRSTSTICRFQGRITDRQRCGYVARTKYDKPADLDDPSGTGAKPKLTTIADMQKNDPTFIDFTMPKPQKITVDRVVIEKPQGDLPFNVLFSQKKLILP
jgi:hypothetical protein